MKMNVPVIIAVLIVAASPAAGQGDAGKTPPQSPGIQLPAPEQAPPAPAPPKKPQQKPAGKEPWPRTFVPTERINADSVVSFPTDI